jgi:gliding motility-associated lipoprotein GldD
MIKLKFSLFLLVTALASCNSDYTIKPRGYFKINLPQKKYVRFEKPGYPYTFEYPTYASIVQDTLFFEDKPDNPYWINILFPQFNGKIYVSYKNVQQNSFESLVKDAFTMAYKQHVEKSTGIEETRFETKNNVSGIYFSLRGNTATANQFFATDSSEHFLRGALYFDATPNEDSLGPVNNFLRQDLQHLINTLQWK